MAGGDGPFGTEDSSCTASQAEAASSSWDLGRAAPDLPLGAVCGVVGARCIAGPIVHTGALGHRNAPSVVDVVQHHPCRERQHGTRPAGLRPAQRPHVEGQAHPRGRSSRPHSGPRTAGSAGGWSRCRCRASHIPGAACRMSTSGLRGEGGRGGSSQAPFLPAWDGTG